MHLAHNFLTHGELYIIMVTITAPLKEDWDSEWVPVRNLLLTIVNIVGYSIPGLLVMREAFDRAPGDDLYAAPYLMIRMFLVG
jgi:hypothetical protein